MVDFLDEGLCSHEYFLHGKRLTAISDSLTASGDHIECFDLIADYFTRSSRREEEREYHRKASHHTISPRGRSVKEEARQARVTYSQVDTRQAALLGCEMPRCAVHSFKPRIAASRCQENEFRDASVASLPSYILSTVLIKAEMSTSGAHNASSGRLTWCPVRV